MTYRIISVNGETATVEGSDGTMGMLIRQEDFNMCRREFRETFPVGAVLADEYEKYVYTRSTAR
jgi:hypothetical protein